MLQTQKWPAIKFDSRQTSCIRTSVKFLLIRSIPFISLIFVITLLFVVFQTVSILYYVISQHNGHNEKWLSSSAQTISDDSMFLCIYLYCAFTECQYWFLSNSSSIWLASCCIDIYFSQLAVRMRWFGELYLWTTLTPQMNWQNQSGSMSCCSNKVEYLCVAGWTIFN